MGELAARDRCALTQEDRSIELKRMPTEGECGVECKTVAMACSNVLNEVRGPFSATPPLGTSLRVFKHGTPWQVDADLSSALYRNDRDPKALVTEVCGGPSSDGWVGELEGSCSKAKPLAPADRAAGESFQTKFKPPPPEPAKKKKKKKKGKKGTKGKEEL